MNEIFTGEILNVTPFDRGFIFAVKKESDKGSMMVKFYGYDSINDRFTSITKSVYLKIKFGYEYEDIAKALGDYVSCDSAFLSDGKVMAVYPGGEYFIFNVDGSVSVSSLLTYRGSGVCDIAPDGEEIWCAVPDENAIIKYNPQTGVISMRIGGGNATTFDRPNGVTIKGNVLYVSNSGSRKVRELNLKTNRIKDIREFKEKVFKYIVAGPKRFVWLKSGLYEI